MTASAALSPCSGACWAPRRPGLPEDSQFHFARCGTFSPRSQPSPPQMQAPLKYLSAYSEQTLTQVRQLIAQDKLGEVLLKRYPNAHDVRNDKALYQYVQDLKNEFLRNAEPINKVAFDSKIHVINHALGLHTSISRVQGGKLKAKHEIRVATMFKEVPIEFLRMIAVHELVPTSNHRTTNTHK